MQIFAQVSNQGTAMSETALCKKHLDTHRRHFELDYSDILGKEEDYRKIPLDDPSWHDCTGNDQLSCNVCGASADTEPVGTRFTVSIGLPVERQDKPPADLFEVVRWFQEDVQSSPDLYVYKVTDERGTSYTVDTASQSIKRDE